MWRTTYARIANSRATHGGTQGRYHALDDLDYTPTGLRSTGSGSVTFTRFIVRFGWTF